MEVDNSPDVEAKTMNDLTMCVEESRESGACVAGLGITH